MDLEMVLNELSLQSVDSVQKARQRMSDLIGTLAAATKSGVMRSLYSDDLDAALLAPDYPLVRWRNDESVAHEERSFFRTLTTKPFDTIYPTFEDQILKSDVVCGGMRAKGLQVAFLLDLLAVSLCSDARWDHNLLEIDVTHFDEEEKLITEGLYVIHASRDVHVQSHKDWIAKRLKTSVYDGNDLWERRKDLFPSLVFCENVASPIQSLGARDPLLRSIVKRLFEIESFSQGWKSGQFAPQSFPSKVSPESQSTLQRYWKERTFICPDGIERLFSWHVRLTPGAWRIHFLPDVGPGRIIIGYIGHKLPTVSYPN